MLPIVTTTMLTTGQKIRENTVIRELGGGNFGIVYEVKNEEYGSPIALKVCRDGAPKEEIDRFKQENTILHRLHTPLHCEQIILPLSVNEEESPFFYYLMELAQGNLDAHIKENYNQTPSELISTFRKICTGVKHAHQLDVVHRDLWWNNVLVFDGDEQQVKLCDFGRAKDHNLEPLDYLDRPCVGHRYVRPPELFFEITDGTNIGLSKKTDHYALGILLSFLFNGTPIIHYSQLVGDIGTYMQQNSFSTNGKTYTEREQFYSKWLETRRNLDYSNLHVSLVDYQLTQEINKIIEKLCDIDHSRRYNSIEELEADLDKLNI